MAGVDLDDNLPGYSAPMRQTGVVIFVRIEYTNRGTGWSFGSQNLAYTYEIERYFYGMSCTIAHPGPWLHMQLTITHCVFRANDPEVANHRIESCTV